MCDSNTIKDMIDEIASDIEDENITSFINEGRRLASIIVDLAENEAK